MRVDRCSGRLPCIHHHHLGSATYRERAGKQTQIRVSGTNNSISIVAREGPGAVLFWPSQPAIKGPRLPARVCNFDQQLDVVASTGAVSPQEIPHWPGQPPCRHYPRPQHRMFWKMQPPDRCQGVRSFASAGREAAAPRDQGGSQSGDLALTETMPGSGPITQGGGHLKFSTRVFLRYLVQWDRSGGRRMRIWGSRLAWGRPQSRLRASGC
jgi:hypothetical protein